MSRDTLEVAIETALRPGEFISFRTRYEFVEGLESLASEVLKLVKTDAARSSGLFETFIAGCFEKANEVDDSGASFATFVRDLFCAWIRARAKAGQDRDETAKRLLAWADKDEYGICFGIEREVVKAFDKPGLAAFERQVRARLARAPEGDFERRRAGDMLRAVYARQRNVPAYTALAGGSPSPADCFAIATMLHRKQKEALAWVERGLAVKGEQFESTAAQELTTLKRDLLAKLGRGSEALADAWAEFRAFPAAHTYEDFMKFVPKTDSPTWHAKAMETIQEADLSSAIDLLVATKEFDRLVSRLREASDAKLEDLHHFTVDPIAHRLEKDHPDVAARLFRAMAVRTLNARKAKYYDNALSNLETAKNCFARAGRTADWDALVAQVRTDHKRKTWFMERFEKLVAGHGPSNEPSFLERARKRWTPT